MKKIQLVGLDLDGRKNDDVIFLDSILDKANSDPEIKIQILHSEIDHFEDENSHSVYRKLLERFPKFPEDVIT